MKVDFVMNNGSIITGDIKVPIPVEIGKKVNLEEFLKEAGEYIIVRSVSIDFVNNKINSFVREMVVTKKDISFLYSIV